MQKVGVTIGASPSKYWALVTFEDKNGVEHERRAEGDRDASKNSNLLQALIEGVQILIRPCMICVYTDSEYIVEPFRQGWVSNWEKHEWRNAKGNTVRNAEQWQQAKRVLALHSVKFEYLRGER